MRMLLIVCMVIAGFARCEMLETVGFNTYFWTSSAEQEVYLFIDGQNKGVLPYLNEVPDCSNEEFKKKALMIHLPSGSYDIVLKNARQETVYNEELRFKHLRTGAVSIGSNTSFKNGGSKRIFKDSCLIEELYFNK